jgi:predicted PurR-regulated permease PerM
MTTQQAPQPFVFDTIRALVFFGLALALLRVAGSVMTILLLGTFLASIAYPTYRRMERRGLPGWAAMFLVMSGFVLFLLIIGLIVYEAGAQFAAEIPRYSASFHAQFNVLLVQLARNGVESEVSTYVRSFTPTDFEQMALSVVTAIGDLLNTFMISLLWVLFLLPSMEGIRRIVAQHAAEHPAVAGIALVAEASVSYFRLRLRLSLLLAVGLTVLYFVMGVPYPALWGALALFLTFIPYVGLFLAVAPPVILIFSIHGWLGFAIGLAFVVLLNMAVENVLQPLWAQDSLKISAAVSFFSVVLWSFVFGFAGSILAVPMTVVLASALALDPQTRWLSDLLVGAPQDHGEAALVMQNIDKQTA